MSRNRSLGLVLLLVLTAGCLGVITGSEPAVFQAEPAGVSESALAETDFELRERQQPWLNRSVEVAGQEREVRVQNHVSSYEIPPSIGPGGVTYGLFVVASTPQASIAGQALNPIGRMSHQQMIEQLASGAGNLEQIQRQGTETRQILGSSTEVVRFSAISRQSGQEVPVFVEVTRVQDGDDFVIGIGVYPQESEGVRPQVATMFESIRH